MRYHHVAGLCMAVPVCLVSLLLVVHWSGQFVKALRRYAMLPRNREQLLNGLAYVIRSAGLPGVEIDASAAGGSAGGGTITIGPEAGEPAQDFILASIRVRLPLSPGVNHLDPMDGRPALTLVQKLAMTALTDPGSVTLSTLIDAMIEQGLWSPDWERQIRDDERGRVMGRLQDARQSLLDRRPATPREVDAHVTKVDLFTRLIQDLERDRDDQGSTLPTNPGEPG